MKPAHVATLAPALVAVAVALQCSPRVHGPADNAHGGRAAGMLDAGAMARAGDAGPVESALATFEELDGDKGSLAAGMRALDRGDVGPELARDLIADAKADTCVRVSFSATTPVSAELLDDHARSLAEAPEATRSTLGDRGPICIRRGDTMRLRFAPRAGTTPHIRFVAWASP